MTLKPVSGNVTSGKGLGVGLAVVVDGVHQANVGEGCQPDVDDSGWEGVAGVAVGTGAATNDSELCSHFVLYGQSQ